MERLHHEKHRYRVSCPKSRLYRQVDCSRLSLSELQICRAAQEANLRQQMIVSLAIALGGRTNRRSTASIVANNALFERQDELAVAIGVSGSKPELLCSRKLGFLCNLDLILGGDNRAILADGRIGWHGSGRMPELRTKREIKGPSKASGDFHLATSDSQSCITTSAEPSPGVIDGITKRLPSAETSNETTE
jgi:hypothetical protein